MRRHAAQAGRWSPVSRVSKHGPEFSTASSAYSFDRAARWLERAPWVWPYGALAILLGLVMLPFWLNSDLMLGGDAAVSNYPTLVVWQEAVARGELPWLNPYRLAGSPAFATPQAQILYPPNWLLLWASPGAMLNWSAGLHVVLAGLAAAWCAGQIGAGRAGQLLAGATYALGSASVARLAAGHVPFLAANAWLPLATGCAIRVGRPRSVELLALTVGMLALAGQPEVPILCLWWLPAWSVAAVVLQSGRRLDGLAVARNVLRTVVGVGLGLGLAGVLLIPVAALHSASGRAGGVSWEFQTVASLPPWYLLGLLSPELFGRPDASYWPGESFEWHERLLYVGLIPLVAALRAPGRWRWACWVGVALSVGLAFAP